MADQAKGKACGQRACILIKDVLLAGIAQNPRYRLLLHWVPALIGITVILVESTATMSAENTSRWLLPLWVKLFGPISAARWGVVHHYIRKTGHFVGYGAVSLGFFDAWRVSMERRWTDWRVRFRNAAGLALLSTLLLASWDEWHQAHIPGRTSSPRDVGLDFCGAVAAHLLLLGIMSLWRKRPGVLAAA
jgi:VanZ family protein